MTHRERISLSRARIDASQQRIAENRENKDSIPQQMGKILQFPVPAAQRERVEQLASRITREEMSSEQVILFDMLLRFIDRMGTG